MSHNKIKFYPVFQNKSYFFIPPYNYSILFVVKKVFSDLVWTPAQEGRCGEDAGVGKLPGRRLGDVLMQTEVLHPRGHRANLSQWNVVPWMVGLVPRWD